MPTEQFISSQLLFAKYRRLYYLLSFSQDKIFKKVKDYLCFKSNISHKNLVQTFFDEIQVKQDNSEELNCISFKKNILHYVHDNLILKSYFIDGEQNNQLNLDKKIFSQQLKLSNYDLNVFDQNSEIFSKIIFNDFIGFKSGFSDVKDTTVDNYQNFDFKDSLSKNTIQINQNLINYLNNEDSESKFQDDNNYFIFDQSKVQTFQIKLKLFLNDKLLDDVANLSNDGIIPKDIIFKNLEDQKIILKVYNQSDKIIKSYVLKNINIFDFKIEELIKNRNDLNFKSNFFNFKGYNIYHDNSIFKHYRCFPYYNNIFIDNISFKILQKHYQIKNQSIFFKDNDYLIVRFYFDKIVYFKDIQISSNDNKNNFDILARGDFNQYTLSFKEFQPIVQYDLKQYQNSSNSNFAYENVGFCCKILDVKIIYHGNKNAQLYYIDLYAYDLDKKQSIHSQYKNINDDKLILLNTDNLIVKNISSNNNLPYCFTQYDKEITGVFNNKNKVIFNNLNEQNDLNNGYFSPDNYYYQSSIQIALKRDAIDKDQHYKYLYLQYQFEKQKDTTTIDLKYFSMFGQYKNFPKIFILSDSSTKRMFVYAGAYIQPSIDVTNKYEYIEKWVFSQFIYENGSQSNLNENNYKYDYIYFIYKPYLQDNVIRYKSIIQLKLNNQDLIDFQIANDSDNNIYIKSGFIIQFPDTYKQNCFVIKNSNNVELYRIQKMYQYRCSCGYVFGDNENLNCPYKVNHNIEQYYNMQQQKYQYRCSCGYVFGDNENLNCPQAQEEHIIQKYYNIQPYYKIRTKQQNNPYQLIIYDKYYGITFLNTSGAGIDRDFKIIFKSGDNKKFKLYSIVFKQSLQIYQHNSQFLVLNNCTFNMDNSVINNHVLGNDLNNITDLQQDKSKYIQNNYYNVLYFINYFNSSKFYGKCIQGNQVMFDESSYQVINKNNLHFSWNKNDLFQYIVLFDNANDYRYNTYFLNSQDYRDRCDTLRLESEKKYYSQQQIDLYYFYSFEKPNIVVGVQSQLNSIFGQNFKIDCYYSYSSDGILWSENKMNNLHVCFYAKYIKVICTIYGQNIEKNYLNNFDVILRYFDSNRYYLTDKNHFDSVNICDLENDNKYLFLLMKVYNGQFSQSKLKLFKAENILSNLDKLNELYIDGNLWNTELDFNFDECIRNKYFYNFIKISGVDRKFTIKFRVQNIEKRFLIRLFCNGQLFKTLQFERQQIIIENNFCQFECQIDTDYFQPFNVFYYNVLYFDDNDNASEISDNVCFYFNNLPSVPDNIGVRQNGDISSGQLTIV